MGVDTTIYSALAFFLFYLYFLPFFFSQPALLSFFFFSLSFLFVFLSVTMWIS